jgi:site-specific DNA-methyltransferase (adenine-specific)
VARKPFKGTVADNVMQHGTGAMNVDGCRICGEVTSNPLVRNVSGYGGGLEQGKTGRPRESTGRWPANFIHDGSDEVVALFPVTESGVLRAGTKRTTGGGYHGGFPEIATHYDTGGSKGSSARFFYCAKASRSERGEGNNHPTVKPIALMEYLCRLATPPGGTVLDPFCGSGTTLLAAENEGFRAVGIDKEPETAERRIYNTAPLFVEEA